MKTSGRLLVFFCAALAQAAAAGAEVLKPARDASWGGYTGYFADPDGHVWEVAWNPDWVLGDDGSVSLRKKADEVGQDIARPEPTRTRRRLP